jgi:hypothetical protein
MTCDGCAGMTSDGCVYMTCDGCVGADCVGVVAALLLRGHHAPIRLQQQQKHVKGTVSSE